MLKPEPGAAWPHRLPSAHTRHKPHLKGSGALPRMGLRRVRAARGRSDRWRSAHVGLNQAVGAMVVNPHTARLMPRWKSFFLWPSTASELGQLRWCEKGGLEVAGTKLRSSNTFRSTRALRSSTCWCPRGLPQHLPGGIQRTHRHGAWGHGSGQTWQREVHGWTCPSQSVFQPKWLGSHSQEPWGRGAPGPHSRPQGAQHLLKQG